MTEAYMKCHKWQNTYSAIHVYSKTKGAVSQKFDNDFCRWHKAGLSEKGLMFYAVRKFYILLQKN